MTVRAKFVCQSITSFTAGTLRKYEFSAAYDPEVPEDLRYAKATPFGTLVMHVDNPAVEFTPGKAYYLTIEDAT